MIVVDIFSNMDKNPKETDYIFDGVHFIFHPEETNNEVGIVKHGITQSQSYLRPHFECIQSWVTAYDVDEGLHLLLWKVVIFIKSLLKSLTLKTRVIGISIRKKNKSSMKIKL